MSLTRRKKNPGVLKRKECNPRKPPDKAQWQQCLSLILDLVFSNVQLKIVKYNTMEIMFLVLWLPSQKENLIKYILQVIESNTLLARKEAWNFCSVLSFFICHNIHIYKLQ